MPSKYENIKNFISSIDNLEKNVDEARNYIKENYNIDSEYDSEKSELRIYCENANNALMNIKAKQYIDDKIRPEFIQVVFGK